jgi:hypothetical protein
VEAASLNWTAEANGSYFPAGQHNSHTLVLANKEELAAGTIAPEMIALSKEMTVLGRGSPKFPVDVTMVLKKEGKDILSRKHAEIVRLQSGQYMIKDCGATNGIFVNMVKVETRTLQPGDVVQFGGYCNLEFGRKIERSDVCIRYLYNYLQPPQPQPQPRGSSKSASLATSASSFASVSDQSKRSATESVKKRADRSDVLVGVGLGASAAKRKKPSSSHSEVSPVPVQVDNLVLELQAVQAQLAYQSKRHKAELDDLAAQRSSEYSEVQRFLQGSRVETEHLKQLLHGGAEELRIKGEEVLELTGERMLLGQQNGALQALVEEKEGRCRSVDNQLRGLRASLSIATAATSVSTGIGMQCISDETLKKTLQCVICEQTLVDAVILPCSHGFCRTCLELKWSVGRPASSASTSSVCRCPSCNIPAAPRRCKVTPKTGTHMQHRKYCSHSHTDSHSLSHSLPLPLPLHLPLPLPHSLPLSFLQAALPTMCAATTWTTSSGSCRRPAHPKCNT